MTRPNATEIIMTGPLMAYAADQLKARFTVHELWKAEDKAAFLREVGERVRGIAGGGHIRIDGALFDALPKLAFDHADILAVAQQRLNKK